MSRDLVADVALLIIAAALATIMILGAKHRSDDEDRQDHDDHFI